MEEATDTSGDKIVEVFFSDLERWKHVQDHLLERNVPMPLEHRWSWLRDTAGLPHWFVVVREGGGKILGALPVQRHATRSLPGHYRLRATHVGYGAGSSEVAAMLEALQHLVRERSELLDVNVEVFSPEPSHRARIEDAVRSLGFVPTRSSRRYHRTARLDLLREEEEIFTALSGECRRGIRDPAKKGYRVEPIVDARLAPRMDELWNETFTRTGMTPPARDWATRVTFAASRPGLFRVVGTFGAGYPEAESLAAFYCAMNNGDHAVYSDGASTRHLNATVSLSYAPLWELIRWARASGCSWFDLGGISEGTHADGLDPRGGIADFKRRFTEDVIEVGGEWRYRTTSLRSWLSQALRDSASTVRSLIRRR